MAQQFRKFSSVREYLIDFKESLSVYKWVWHNLIDADGKRWTKLMLILMSISMIFSAAQPWFAGKMLDGAAGKSSDLLLVGFIGTGLCFLGEQGLRWWQDRVREYSIGQLMWKLEVKTSEMFFNKSLGQHLTQTDILSSANIEKGRARVFDLEIMLFFEGFPTLLKLLVSVILLWILSPTAGAVMTGVVLHYLAWTLYLNPKVVSTLEPLDEDFRAINRYRTDRWDGITRLKTHGKEEEEAKHIHDWFFRVLDQDRDFWLWFINVNNFRSLGRYVGLLLIWGYGAWQVWLGNWNVGMLIPLISWSHFVSNELWQIGNVEHRLNWNLPAVRSMMKALTLESDIKEVDNAETVTDNKPVTVRFDKVTHAYPGYNPVLRDVSFCIQPGEKVALVGPSGAGKTTVTQLLLRAMDPMSGSIHLNGSDLREVRLSSWLQQLACIAQKPEVFAGTLRDNLVYALSPTERKEISDDVLWKLMRDFQVDFGERLKNGLDTKVGKEGIELSGGQKQRLLIAAALIKQPNFCIIDEATCSLDSTTERVVQSSIEQILSEGNRSALIIAHRLDTLRFCDKIVVLRSVDSLKNGDPQVEIVARSFEEAYEKSPTFRRLADDQGVSCN